MSQTAATRGTSIELVVLPGIDQISAVPPLTLSKTRTAESIISNRRASFQNLESRPEDSGSINVMPTASRFETAMVITLVTLVTGLGTLITGTVTVAIPVMAKDVGLDQHLLLWPASIYSLVCGCTLLLMGSLSDVVGARTMYLTGCFLQGIFNLASGLSRNGGELIAFRALAGLSISFCLPSATAVITNTFPPGQTRNIAFASMGGSQPIGFAFGLAAGGVMAGTIGWRWAFYIAAILNIMLFLLAWWAIPRDGAKTRESMTKQLINDIDWVGAVIASAALGLISYVFASIASSTSSIKSPFNITLLTLSLLLFPTFHFWVSRQEKLHKPSLIPPSLWRSPVFTSICVCVFMTWGGFNALEQLLTFYFQYVQLLSPLQSALRFMAAPVSGALANILVGLLVARIRGDLLVGITSALALVSPILLALATPQTSYWRAAFPAILLNSPGADMLFTISNLLITERFPARTQGLAGGVFQTLSQIGKAVGLALSAVVANSITQHSGFRDKGSPDALMEGYKAAWWFTFGLSFVTFVAGAVGLRKVGKVGEKKD